MAKIRACTQAERETVRGMPGRTIASVLCAYFTTMMFFLFYQRHQHLPSLQPVEFAWAQLLLVFLAGGVLCALVKWVARWRDSRLPDWAMCLAAAVATVASRLALFQIVQIPMTSDYRMYFEMAEGYAQSRFYPATDYIMVVAPNIFPFILILGEIFSIFGSTLSVALNMNLACLTGSVVCIYLLAREMMGKRLSMLAAMLFSLSPSNLLFSLCLNTESMALFLYLLGTLLMTRTLRGGAKHPWRNCLLAGLALGLSNSIRSNALIMIITLAGCALAALRRLNGASRKHVVAGLLSMLLGVVLITEGISLLRDEAFEGRLKGQGMGIGWTMYEGLDVNSAGGWTQENSDVLNETIRNEPLEDVQRILLGKAIERVSSLSAPEWADLLVRKGINIWIYNDYAYQILTEDAYEALGLTGYEEALRGAITWLYWIALAAMCLSLARCAIRRTDVREHLTILFLMLPVLIMALWHSFATSIPRYHYFAMPSIILIICFLCGRERAPREASVSVMRTGKAFVAGLRDAVKRAPLGRVVTAAVSTVCLTAFFIQALEYEWRCEMSPYPVLGRVIILSRVLTILLLLWTAGRALRTKPLRKCRELAGRIPYGAWTALFMLLGAAARAIAVIGFGAKPELTMDMGYQIAETLAGGAYAPGTIAYAANMRYAAQNVNQMAYPVLILPAFLRLFGTTPVVAQWLNVFFGAVCVGLIGWQVRMISGKRSALCAMLLTALIPKLTAQAALTISDCFAQALMLFTSGTVVWIYQAVRGQKQLKPWHGVIPLSLGGSLILGRSFVAGWLAVPLCLAALLMLPKDKREAGSGVRAFYRRPMLLAIIFLLASTLMGFIVSEQMEHVLDEKVPGVVSGSGYSLMVGQGVEGSGRWNAEDDTLRTAAAQVHDAVETSAQFMAEFRRRLNGLTKESAGALYAEKLNYLWRMGDWANLTPDGPAVAEALFLRLGIWRLMMMLCALFGIWRMLLRSGCESLVPMIGVIGITIAATFFASAAPMGGVFYLFVIWLASGTLTVWKPAPALPQVWEKEAAVGLDHLRHDIRQLLGRGVTMTVTRSVVDSDRQEKREIYANILNADGFKVIDGAARNGEAGTTPPNAPER